MAGGRAVGGLPSGALARGRKAAVVSGVRAGLRPGLTSRRTAAAARKCGGSRTRVVAFAADEPRPRPKTDSKKELAQKALEQALQGKESMFAKLDEGGNDGGGNGSGDRGGGGGGGGGNNGEDWGEVFNMAVKAVIYLFIGIIFLVVWPRLFSGASNMYNKMTGKEQVSQVASSPAKEDFDESDFEDLAEEASTGATAAAASAKGGEEEGEGGSSTADNGARGGTKVKRAFPEREAFDTWQFGAAKGMDLQDELAERELQMETVQEEMLDREGKFRDEFNAKPRSKHVILKDTKPMGKPGPYEDYITKKWK